MARARKDGIHINYYINKEVKELLDKYCEEVGQTHTMAIERILRKHINEYFSKNEIHYNK